ncbi:MAG: hypothetical protein WA152_03420 [Microgenomates group bacterium]
MRKASRITRGLKPKTLPTFDPTLQFIEEDGIRFQKGFSFEEKDGNWVPTLLSTDPEQWLTDATRMIRRGLMGYGIPER